MEAEVYKTLLKQAEDELGATPGAYCSRKAALRAMELLREAGELEFDEADKKWAEVGRQAIDSLKTYIQTIERQAQAIRRLEEEKMRGRQSGAGLRQVTPKRRSWDEMEREINEKKRKALMRNSFMWPEDSLRRTLNIKLDNAGDWKQF